MIVKVINENPITDLIDLNEIKIKIEKIWDQICTVSPMTYGPETTSSLNNIVRNVVNSAIDADKIVIIDQNNAKSSYDGTFFNRLLRIEKDICRYLNKEIYHESDLDRMIKEKEKENVSKELDDTETVPDGCMYQSICTSCFLQKIAKDPDARIYFGKSGMCFVEHAKNERKEMEKIHCIGSKCALYNRCFCGGFDAISEIKPATFVKAVPSNNYEESWYFLCKRDGGPIPVNLGGTLFGDGMRLDGTCCCRSTSGSGKSVTGRNEASCGCDPKPNGQS